MSDEEKGKDNVNHDGKKFDQVIKSFGMDIDSIADFIQLCHANSLQAKDVFTYIQSKADQTTKKRKRGPNLMQFDPTIKKKQIVIGDVSSDLGGLLDRDYSIECLFKNLQYLATLRGKKTLDKKQVPVLAVAAPSESGKTEFLKWINNHCCMDLNPDVNGIAVKLLHEINAASPEGQEKFEHVLVLFASFNQSSTYDHDIEKGIIVKTTIERLLRSHQGNVDMTDSSETGPTYSTTHFLDFNSFRDILKTFENAEGRGKTAFIFCIDELSKLRGSAYEDYKQLMDRLLDFSHVSLRDGGYCAIVASSLAIADLGGYVVQQSGRSLAPIYFRDCKPMIRKKALELFLERSSVLDCGEEDKEKELFICSVRTAILESYTSIFAWWDILNVNKSTKRMKIRNKIYGLPDGISVEDVFEICSQTLFKTQKKEPMCETKLDGIVNKLHGSVQLSNEDQVNVTSWTDVDVRYSLPAHRLLQIPSVASNDHVEEWVIHAVHKLYYENETANEIVKAWELATIALLDLRRAMLCDAKGSILPKLKNMFVKLDGSTAGDMFVHHTLDDVILNADASHTRTKQQQSKIPHGDNICDSPTVITSKSQNEKGIEGVFQNAFHCENGDSVHVFFQMKLYTMATPKQISKWLCSVSKRAVELGYLPGTYIVQLFVTGAVESNIEDHKNEWPKNSMVFGTAALKHLFEPFGAGFIVEIVNARTRKSDLVK